MIIKTDSFSDSAKLSTEIANHLKEAGFLNVDFVNGVKNSMHPFISNAMYSRDNQVLENERYETFVTLARTLDNEQLEKAFNALRYKLTVEKK
jgi:hypothetical protein